MHGYVISRTYMLFACRSNFRYHKHAPGELTKIQWEPVINLEGPKSGHSSYGIIFLRQSHYVYYSYVGIQG